MSIKERVQAWEARREVERAAEQAARIAIEKELEVKYRREYPEVRAQQEKRLANLREAGIISMLEDVIGEPISTIAEYDEQRKQDALGDVVSIIGVLDGYNPEKWSYEFQDPTLLDNKMWNDSLRIVFSRGTRPDDHEFVFVQYSEPTLIVQGDQGWRTKVPPVMFPEKAKEIEGLIEEKFKYPFRDRASYNPIQQTGYKPQPLLNRTS